MTKEQALADCRAIDLTNAVISLWVFKRSSNGTFRARSIDMTPALTAGLRTIVRTSLHERTEIDDYQPLALVNEASCLHVSTDETCFSELKQLGPVNTNCRGLIHLRH